MSFVAKLLGNIRCYIYACILLFPFPSISQVCSPLFNKTYGGLKDDEALFIQNTSDKGAIISGRTTSTGAGDYDAFLMKISQDGQIQWSKTYGGFSYDDLVKVRSTLDGGYIALGLTKSFGNGEGESFLVKTSSSGGIQWSLRLPSIGTGREQPKDLAVLKDGSFVVLVNRDDSTIKGDGLVCKLSSTGTVLWAKAFDHGKSDGVNTIAEEGDSLVIGGFAEVKDREGILMKISSSTGSIFWAKRYAKSDNLQDELVNVECIPGGIAFTMTSVPPDQHNQMFLGEFKRLNDDTYSYKGFSQISPGGGFWHPYNVVSRLSLDKQFIYFMNDSMDQGHSDLVKLNNGWPEFGRQLYKNDMTYSRMTGLDTSQDNGYWLTGYSKSWMTTHREIQVYKVDKAGFAGSCIPPDNADFTDWADYIINDFSWNNVSNATISPYAITLVVQDANFSQKNSCDSVYCEVNNVGNDSCKATLLSFLRAQTRLDLQDVEVANDGGCIAAGHFQEQPFLLKLAPNGKLQWAKSYTTFYNSLQFNRIIPTQDGNYLAAGTGTTIIDHGIASHSVLMKINDKGDILWSKNYNAFGMSIYTAVSTPDGGFIVCATGAYGIGYTYSHMFRVSSSGNINWKKQINHGTWYPVYKNLYLEGNDLYALADTYQTTSLLRIERWDASNGTMVWYKRAQTQDASVFADFITKIKDTIYVGVHDQISTGWSSYSSNIIVSKFDVNGNLLGNLRLTKPNHSLIVYNYDGITEHQPFSMIKANDNNFVVAQQAQTASGLKLNITKFTPGGSVIWSREYPNLPNHMVRSIKNDGDNLLIGGRIDLQGSPETNLFSSFILKTDSKGRIKENADGFCKSDSLAATMEITDKITPHDFPESVSVVEDVDVVEQPLSLTAVSVQLDAELQCSLPSACFNVTLSGPDSICSIKDTLFYSLDRNAGCNTAATWLIDSSTLKIIATTDTTIRVLPRKAGYTSIIARIQSGCSLMVPTAPLHIKQGADELNLGADTVICPGNTMLLHGQAGFFSYKWQDGSSNKYFEVKAPGTYQLTVIDSCGHSFQDKIIISEHPPIPFNAGPDRIKCNGDTLHLSAPTGFMNYQWSNNYNISSLVSQNVIVNPSMDTAYYIKAEKESGCFAFDTIKVTVFHSPDIHLGSDTSFCKGQTLTLDAGTGFSSYLWNDGSKYPQLLVSKVGSYSVTGFTALGCKSYDTVNIISVYPLPYVLLDKNPELCQGSSRTLDPGVFKTYAWQDGSKDRLLKVNAIGDYYVQVMDYNGCTASDTVSIRTILPLPQSFLPADTSICSYGTLVIRPLRSFTSYQWNTGSGSPSITIDKPGSYSLEVHDSKGCMGRDSLLVNPKDCMMGVYIPTAFTPNADGKNDLFKALVYGPVKNFKLTVYNRWGEIVFESVDPNKGWNGQIGGRELDTGVYIWMCKYELGGAGLKVDKGTVSLIH